MSIEYLIAAYGYYAIVIGTFLEGETILILAAFLAHRGYLTLPLVIFSGFMGTLFGDQLYYYLGRSKVREALQKRPRWKLKSAQVFSFLEKHQVWFILGFRFLYGLRTVSPFIIGASRIPPLRFLILNILGALLWALVIAGLGYLLGHTLELFISDLKKYELFLFAVIAGVGIVIRLAYVRKNYTAWQLLHGPAIPDQMLT